MTLFGLHLVDWIVIFLYFIAMIAVALWARRRVRNTSDFYQGGRSFGKVLTAFLNFGNMTDAGQAAAVSREIYRQGLPGVWFQNLVLFHTPFQWFTSALQRRARYLGPADMFLHRFESRFLAGLYAAVLIATAAYGNASGFLLTGKTLQAMMVKPAAEYTVAERSAVEGFGRLQELKKLDYASLDESGRSEMQTLRDRENRGELKSFVSYLDLTTFYLLYAFLIAAYTVLGGLFAIAVIDVIQGVLIIFLSLTLIPVALIEIGGVPGLRERVAPGMFELFGSSASSEYTWYFVASFALLNLVVNAPKSFTLGGAPKDDRSARIGFVSGAIFKRFMMVGWAFTGLLAVGLYAGEVSDPTNIWGHMTRDLLGAGAIGLMIAAIFSANMDGAATSALDASAAFTKNILAPVRPDLSERSQVAVGRITVFMILCGSVYFAGMFDDIVAVFKYALSIGAIVGPAFWLAYFWRRVNTRAVVAQMLISIALTIAIPNIVPRLPGATVDPELTTRTVERMATSTVPATRADVTAGRAATVGAPMERTEQIPPAAIYFERVVKGADGETRGEGLFRTQIWILSRFGIDFTTWSAAGIGTASFLFDAIVPFLLLMLFSLVTRPNSTHILNDFYARIHTPAEADRELDERLVREKIEDPSLVERNKLFPKSEWMFWKPTRFDILGFLACIGFVLLIVCIYIALGSLAG